MTFEVRLSPAAAREYRKLPAKTQSRVRKALEGLAARSGASRGGKTLKIIHGRRDRFYRLRVGEVRVMFDRLDDDRVLLVLGIVERKDLERWLRAR